MVQTRIKGGIICVTVTGKVGGKDVTEVINQVTVASTKIRKQKKNVLVLVDISGIKSENSQARLEAMKLLKLNYDKLAVFGASEDISQVVLYLIRTTAMLKKARYFNTESEARFWLLQSRKRRVRVSLRSLGATLISTLLLVGIIWVCIYSWISLNQRRMQARENYADSLKTKLDGRLSTYIDQGLGFVSLINASEHVTGNEFNAYFLSSKVSERYPGFTAISFIRYVDAPDVDQINNEVLADPIYQARGITSFIQPSNKSFYLPVVFIEPLPDSNASYGLDLSASQERTENLMAAMQNGKVAFSKPFNLVDASGNNTKRLAFIITQPIYKGLPATTEQRKQHIYGFINAVFVYNDFFAKLLQDDLSKGLNIKIVSDNQTVYESTGHKNIGGATSRKLNTSPRNMQFEVTFPQNFGLNRGEDSGPAFLFVVGMLIWGLGNILYITNVRRRSSAVKLAEKINEDLQVGKAKDNALLGAIGEGLIAIDTVGRITRINKLTAKLLGYSEKELVGSMFSEIVQATRFDGTPIPMHERPIMKSLAENHVINDSFYYCTKSGREIPVRVSVAPVLLRGKLLGSIELFQDITSEHELDKAKDDFIGLVSHQLSTPATAVKANLGMILQGYATSKKEIADAVSEAYESNERQINIVQDFLNVARLDNRRLVIDYEKFDLKTLLEQTIRDAKTDLTDRGHKVSLKVEGNIELFTDKSLFDLVIGNLLSNASKYSKQKTPITVKARRTKNSVAISVIDRGVGIASKDQDKLFQRFSRISNPLSGDIGGTGLGLYIAKQLVELMHGSISMHSKVGKGSEFLVKLPLGEPHD